jgi:hypothetical protein
MRFSWRQRPSDVAFHPLAFGIATANPALYSARSPGAVAMPAKPLLRAENMYAHDGITDDKIVALSTARDLALAAPRFF